jgi:hypothetical protein
MATPKRNRSHPDDPAFERTRDKIQATQLIKRLQNYALNQPDEQGNKVELDAGRLKAIDMLLNKTLPNLKAIEINNKQDNIMPVLKISLAGERKA